MLKLARGLFRRRSRKVVFFTSLVAIIVLMSGGFVFARLGGFGDTGSSINLNAGLVGWWKLDGNAKDSTPYQNNGTVNGTTPVADRFGNSNGALSFNGTTDQVSISGFTHNVMLPSAFGASWTLSIWAKWAGTNANEHILLGKQGCNGGIYTWNNQYQFALKASACWTGAQAITATSITDTSQWHLLTATYAAGSMAFYADGVLQGTATLASMTSNYNTSTIGIGSTGNNSYNFSGQLDDARIYNRALSAAEAKALFDQGSTGINVGSGQKGLVGWWKMNGNTKDSTPYGNNASLINSPTYVADRKGKTGSAIGLNGNNSYVSIPDVSSLEYSGQNFTASMWVKPNSTEVNGGYILSKPWNGTGQYNWQIFYTGGSKLNVSLQGNTSFTLYGSKVLPPNVWSLVSLTISSTGTTTLYVNGVQDVSNNNGIASWTPTLGNSHLPLAVGTLYPYASGWGGNTSYSFDGSVGDLRTYNRVLSTSDLSNQYNSYNSQIALGGSGDVGSVSLGKGLVGYWPFNGNAKDATPYGNNGAPTGVPTLTTDRKGRANSAYSMNGVNQYFNASTNSLPSSAITVSTWVNQSAIGNWYDFVSNHWGGGLGLSGWDLYTSVGGNVYFGIWNSPNPQYSAQCTAVITTNNWIMITGSSDGTTLKVYVNGALCGSAAIVGNPTLLTTQYPSFSIGDNSAPGSYSLDDVRIYNRALNANEVTALYNLYN